MKLCECGCGKEVIHLSAKFLRGHNCRVQKNNELKIKTCLIKYGVRNVMQYKEVREKYKHNFKQQYGVDNPQQLKEIQNKTKQTCLHRYGVENPNQSKDIREKTKQTCLFRYGIEYIFQSKEIKDKIKHSILLKYGVENPKQSVEIKNRIKKMMVDKGIWISDECCTYFELYYRKVRYFTNRSIREKYSKEELKQRKYSGVNDGFHIDHKFSIWEGFNQGIVPHIIGCQSNIELIPWLDNILKHTTCSITKEELFKLYDQEKELK